MIAQINSNYIKLGFLVVYRRLLSYFLFEGRPLTTRGRWINNFVFLLFRFFNLFPILSPSISPVFLVGIGRSGTTLLGKLLSAHSQIGYLNEPKAIWHYAFGNEDLIGSYAFDDTKAFLRPTLSTNDKGSKRIKKIYGWYKKLSGTRILLDKYPELIFRVNEIKNIFPNVKFVAIVRNGYAVAESIHEWSERHRNEKENTDWWGKNDRKWNLMVQDILADQKWSHLKPYLKAQVTQKERGVVEWWHAMNELRFCLNKHSDMFHLVHYERLCESPNKEISAILDFLDISMETKMMTFVENEINHTQRQPNPAMIPSFIKDEFLKMQSAFDYETE